MAIHLLSKRECENYLEGEEREMIELYVQRGMSEQDAEVLVKILSKDKEIFVNFMMLEELELIAPDDSINPVLNGNPIVCHLTHSNRNRFLFSYLWRSSSPSVSRVVLHQNSLVVNPSELHLQSLRLLHHRISCPFLLWGYEGKEQLCDVDQQSHFNVTVWWVSGLQMAFNGSLAFGISYSIGSYLPSFIFTH